MFFPTENNKNCGILATNVGFHYLRDKPQQVKKYIHMISVDFIIIFLCARTAGPQNTILLVRNNSPKQGGGGAWKRSKRHI